MKRAKKRQRSIARELSEAEQEKILLEIGELFKAMRDDRTTVEKFGYETNIALSQLGNYDKGGDMRLSTFLKLLHGLGITGEAFFKKLKK